MSNAPILNPDTPLAFLDPLSAYQTSVSLYVTVAALGLIVWDILDNLAGDVNAIFFSGFKLSAVAYLGSRVGTLGYALSSSIFETAATGHCAAFEKITDVWYPVSLSFSALLFFLRVKAIYEHNPLVVAFFFILWLALLGCTMLIPILATGDNIAITKYCEDDNVPSAVYAAVVAPLVHDTLVFVVISWRLVRISHAQGFKDGWRVALLGHYLPTFTKSLLLDGQKYYLVTLVSSLVTVIMNFDKSVPVPMRTMFATLNVVLVNIMACRVFRRTKSGLLREREISSAYVGETESRIRPALITIPTNRIRRPEEMYQVDVEQGGNHEEGLFVVTNDTNLKTMVNTDGKSERSDVDVSESPVCKDKEQWAT